MTRPATCIPDELFRHFMPWVSLEVYHHNFSIYVFCLVFFFFFFSNFKIENFNYKYSLVCTRLRVTVPSWLSWLLPWCRQIPAKPATCTSMMTIIHPSLTTLFIFNAFSSPIVDRSLKEHDPVWPFFRFAGQMCAAVSPTVPIKVKR